MLAPVMTEGNNDPDHPGSLSPQIAGHLIGPKPVLACQQLDPVTGCLVDQILACQRARDGPRRNTRDLGEVGQCTDFAVWCGLIVDIQS